MTWTPDERGRAAGAPLPEALLQARLERLRAFAGVAAHDLKAPLMTVSTNAELLQLAAHDRLTAEERARLGVIQRAALDLGSLVDRLLLWTQVDARPPAPRPVDLAAFCQEVLDSLGALVETSGARITLGSLPVVVVDADLLRILLLNLVTNALKYRSPARPAQISIEALPGAGGCWELRVGDNGMGIEPPALETIFAMFDRGAADGSIPGTGIGLALTAQVVARLGGTIHVESDPARGSTFRVRMPALPPT